MGLDPIGTCHLVGCPEKGQPHTHRIGVPSQEDYVRKQTAWERGEGRCAFVFPPEPIRCVSSAVRGSSTCLRHSEHDGNGQHDSQCESEFISGPNVDSPCGCAVRRF